MANAIRIPTKLNTDGIKGDVKALEKLIRSIESTAKSTANSLQKDIDRLTASVGKSKDKYEELQNTLSRLQEKREEAEQELIAAQEHQKEMRETGSKEDYNAAIKATQQREQELAKIDAQMEKIQQKADAELRTQERLNEEIANKVFQRENVISEADNVLSAKQQELDAVRQQVEAEKEKLRLSKEYKKGLDGIIGKVKTISLSILGARTAYTFIRKIISEALADNQQLQNTLTGFWGSLGSLVAPVINYIVQGLATILNYAMAIIQALTGINMLAKANQKIAKKNGAGGSNKKGNLASFDRSEVLNKNSGGGVSGTNASYLKNIKLSERMLAIIEAIKNIWNRITQITKEWIQTVNFEKLISAFNMLLDTIAPAINTIGDYLISIYERAVLPIAKFFIESIIPNFLEGIAHLLSIITSVLNVLLPPLELLWDNIIAPFAEKVGDVITYCLELINEKLKGVSDWFDQNGDSIVNQLMEAAKKITEFYNQWIAPVIDLILQFFHVSLALAVGFAFGLLESFLNNVDLIIDDVMLIFDGLIDFLTGVFSGDWEKAWGGIKKIFAGIWNGMIDIVQTVINGIVNALNFVVDKVNGMNFTVPEWIPWIGGSSFSPHLDHISSVDLSGWKVPALAQGAVIQPNQPFMAMLGDQRQGRNIEAPEDLIRQIVAEESSRPVNIVASGEVGQLIKFLHFELQKEDSRVGQSLVIG